MPKNDIGGFFVSLGLNIDKNSFETGNKLIDDIGNSFNKLIGTARNAAVVLAGTAIATGSIESQSYKTATALGMTTEALDLWKASAKIAGVSADGLVSSMSRMGNVLSHAKIDASGFEDLSRKLGEIGMHMDELQDESGNFVGTDEAYRRVVAKGQQLIAGGADRQDIIVKMGDILGGEGQNFFIELLRQNKTIDEFLKGAGNTVFTNSKTNEMAADFSAEFNELKTTIESIGKLFGSEVGGKFTPYISKINDFIQNNKTTIIDGITRAADATEKIVGKTVELVAMLSPYLIAGMKSVGADMNQVLTGMGQIMRGEIADGVKTMTLGINFEDAVESATEDGMSKAAAKTNLGARSIPGYGTLVHGADWFLNKTGFMSDAEYNAYWAAGGYVDQAKGKTKKTQDGILRPDGTLTQVAPDDWVFAARSVSDLARAFIPQNYAAAPASNEYVINQTFNISGSSDMPQILRQQAYKGTQEGLLEIMNQSSRRLQLMSGTR